MVRSLRQKSLILYIAGDMIISLAVWMIFIMRMSDQELSHLFTDFSPFWQREWSFIIVPVFWVLLYLLFGEYKDPYRKTRFKTFSRTFWNTAVGILILFIVDMGITESFGVMDMAVYFIFQFAGIGILRIVHLTVLHDQIQRGQVTFNTILIGSSDKACQLYQEIQSEGLYQGYNILGFINTNGAKDSDLSMTLPELGTGEDIPRIVEKMNIEEVLVAIEKDEYAGLQNIMDVLFNLGGDVAIKIIPDMYDILLGKVRLNYVFGAILIEVEREIMPRWQRILKRLLDIVTSVLFFLLFWWLFLYIAIRVRMSSEGPVFYQQERIGLGGRPFIIYKFRSMYTDAEAEGPQLSFEGDARCTPWGSVMRKWRIDELPQFWNVLKGDMSLVGPRPERAYFIEKIMEKAPHYRHLLRVKPGITSWGQVKYGYASSVEEMIQRLKYDILYIENRSFALDIKILFYTLLVLVKGSGK